MKSNLSIAAAASLCLLASGSVFGQDVPKIKVSGYLEAYYGYDFAEPEDNNRPGYVYSHNRHNEVALNLGFLKGSYDAGNLRANIALMAGTYTNANLAAEPGVLKNVFEANIGVKLSRSKNLWLDAGIFPSHIGFESAISKDCWVLTRNISSENTPYYESGAKLGYSSDDGKFSATLLYLNGWQKIARADGNSNPAGGLQLTWKPGDRFVLNYSNYLGTEGPDSISVRRFYHNLYGIVQLTDQLGLTLGLDYGTQQVQKGSDEHHHVLSPLAIMQYKISAKWSLAGRVEHYRDEHNIFIATPEGTGFEATGYSLNLDYSPFENAVIRAEGKAYHGESAIFTTSMAISF